MELEKISISYMAGFTHRSIKNVLKAIERLPLEIGSDLPTFMEVFPYGNAIGICPEEADKIITCDNLYELPENYKTETFFGTGGNTSMVWISEFSIDKPDICVERYALFLVPYARRK